MKRLEYSIIAILLLGMSAFMSYSFITRASTFEFPFEQYGVFAPKFDPGSVLFVPDIMLGRAVEDYMQNEGVTAPFENVRNTVNQYDAAIANFEASVPKEHRPTPIQTMRFSVREEYLDALKKEGFDILSLANNHALDHGESGHMNTRASCEAVGLYCIGHPTELTASSTFIFRVGSTRVGVLMLNAVFQELDHEVIRNIVTDMSSKSDIQFAFIHWGNEYERTHAPRQKALAQILIDAGIDAVIGHHPHVIQDIGEYNGKPIFYSLGNFIFDQSFSEDVQNGYAVGVSIERDALTYTLLPYDTFAKRMTPRLKEGDDRMHTLKELLSGEEFTDVERKHGKLIYPR